jgi:arginine/lysine/histidine transporter system substrate-binding protein
LDDLDAGLIEVVFNDYLNSLVYIKEHPNVKVQGEIFDPAGYGISVKTGDTELLNFVNTTLKKFEENGEIERLFDKWVNPETAQ